MLTISTVLTLSTTPQQIGSSNQRRQQVTAVPDSGTTLYVGASDVTTSTGVPYVGADGDVFDVYQAHADDKTPGAPYYAVGTGSIRVLEIVSG